MKNYILYILIAILIFSCEEEFDLEPAEGNLDLLVIDGILTNEKKPHEITVTFPSPDINIPGAPVTGATVFISNGVTTFLCTESEEKDGKYYTDSIRAVIGRTYQLTVNYEGNTYFAVSEAIAVTDMYGISIDTVFTHEDTLFKASPSLRTSEPAMFELLIDWRHLEPIDDNDELQMARTVYYNLGNIDVPQVFAAGQETVYFPEGTIIIEKKYSLNEDHTAFLRSLLLETQWTGGNFDASHANLLTNLSEGAIGFFGVCQVKIDTVVVE